MKPKSNSGSRGASVSFQFDKSGVRTVSYEDRADDILNLPNIDVFNQQDLEQGLLMQANDAFEQECKRQKFSVQQELSSIDEDIRLCEGELASIGEILENLAGGETSSSMEVRQRMASIKKQEQNKVNQLRTLNSRKYSLQQKLKRLSETPKVVVQNPPEGAHQPRGILDGRGAKETDEARRIRLGETTPFQGRKNGVESKKKSGDVKRCGREASSVVRNPAKRLKRCSSNNNNNNNNENDRCDYNGDSGDDEWRPKEEDDDSEIGSDVSFETDDELGEIPLKDHKRSGRKRIKRKRVKLNRNGGGRALEDDWCDEVYRARIRELGACEMDANEDEKDEAFDGGFAVPGKIWKRLFPYQRTGVRWLWELHTQEVGGILGDEMGLGKTLQVIGLLASLQHSRLKDKSMVPRYEGLGPTLVICPATVMHQWLGEFRSWWPRLRVVVVHSNGGSSTMKPGRLMASLFPAGPSGRADSFVVISSYSTVHRHSTEFLKRPWHYLVLDEGHKIRNPDAQITLVCKQFRTCHRIIVSGSPVQNNLKELWSLFDFIFPGKLGTLPDFMGNFNVPIAQGQYATSSDVQVETAYKCAETLRDIISPYLLRRMKKDVQSSVSLPNKNEQVLFCRLTDYQRRVYREYLSSREFKMIVEGRLMAFSGLITIRKICNHPDICTGVPKDFWSGKEKEQQKQEEEEEEGGRTYGYWKRSGKMVVVEALLSMWKKQKHKVLLFTQSRQMLDIIELFVRNRSYSYFRMDGATNVQARQPLIAEFNKNPNIFLFLLTTRVGGLGINLTGASRVIIYDPDWNPSTDVQARERAWRIGQKADVTVYRLLTTGTIEEKIYQRQIFKQFLTNRVLNDPRQRRFFDSTDLRGLFTLKDDEGGLTETGAIFAGTGSDVKVPKKSSRREKNDDGKNQRKRGKRRRNGVDDEDSREVTTNRFDLLRKGSSKSAVQNDDEDEEEEEEGRGDESESLVDTGKSGPQFRETADEDASATRGVVFDGSRVQGSDSTSGTRDARLPSSSIAIDEVDFELGALVSEAVERNCDSQESRADLNGECINSASRSSNSLRLVTDGSAFPEAFGGRSEEAGVEKEDDDKDEETKRRMELARKLSRKISQMVAAGARGNDSVSDARAAKVARRERSDRSPGRDERKMKKKKKKHDKSRPKNAELEGAKITNLDKVDSYADDTNENNDDDNKKKKKEGKDDRNGNSNNNKDDDDYVLKKLFKRSGVHSAMHHERIVASGDPDYRLVELEAERVAREAERALKASRERCRRAALGQPTWTGANGSVGAPRFGPRKPVSGCLKAEGEKSVSSKEMQRAEPSTSGGSNNFPPPQSKPKPPFFRETNSNFKTPPAAASDSSPSSSLRFHGSTLIPTRVAKSDGDAVEIKPDAETERSRGKQEVVTSTDLISMLKSKSRSFAGRTDSVDAAESPEADDLELIEDIRAFVSVGGRGGPGSVTSEELVGHFRTRVPPGRSVVFKEMTRRLCNFYRVDGVGIFSLRTEHRRES